MSSSNLVSFLLAALVAATCAAAPGARADSAAEPAWELLPDTGGQIESAVISVNSARRAALRNAELITRIVNGLPASVRIAILTNDRAAFTVARNPWRERIRFIELPFGNPITIWTQDPFLVLRATTGGGTTLLTSKGFERADDRLMAAKIATDAGYHLKTSKLYFEGGNIVSDSTSIFIGANTIRYNALELAMSEVEVVLKFQQELGRRVLVVGPAPQAVGHIDMMLTPVGDGRLVLADPAQGARIAEQALLNHPESVTAFERHAEDYFFGHPAIREIAGPDGATLSAPRIQGGTREMIELSRRIAPILDKIAEALSGYGYQVERVPFLFGGPESRRPAEAESSTQAGYPMLTYNNVLVENDGDKPMVYLPQYGWPAMDEAAAKAWKGLGFIPRSVEGLTVSAMYGGALRCSVKVLERKQPKDPPLAKSG